MDYIKAHNPSALHVVLDVMAQDEIPEYVKEANQLEEADVKDLSSIAFADIVNRELPIHNKVATWLSAAYVKGNEEKVNRRVQARIKKAAANYGIEKDVELMETRMDETIKQAAETPIPETVDYAVSLDYGNDRGIKNFYPIKNAAQTVDSAMKLMRDEKDGKLPIELVKVASVEIVKAANTQDIFEDQIPQRVWNLGIERVPDFDKAAEVAEQRRWEGVGDEGVELYKGVVKSASEDSPENMDQWIECFSNLDKIHNIKYSTVILDPFQAFYSGDKVDTLKKASQENIIVQGVLIPVGLFTSLPADEITKNFNKYAADMLFDLQKKASVDTAHANTEMDNMTDTQCKTLLKLLVNHDA